MDRFRVLLTGHVIGCLLFFLWTYFGCRVDKSRVSGGLLSGHGGQISGHGGQISGAYGLPMPFKCLLTFCLMRSLWLWWASKGK